MTSVSYLRVFIIFSVLLEYQQRFGYYPKKLDSNKELDKLLDVRNDVFDSLRVDNDLLAEDFSRLV